MVNETVNGIVNQGKNQANFLKQNPFGFLLSAMISGIFMSVGPSLSAAVWVQNVNSPFIEFLSSALVPIGITMVIFAGTMIFPGSTFISTLSALKQNITWKDVLKVLIVVHIGNWSGTILFSFLFLAGNQFQGGVGEYIIQLFSDKTDLNFWHLLARAFMANIWVCAAVWSTFRSKSDSGKIIMIILCHLAYMATGFENSVANMSQGSLALLATGGMEKIGIAKYLYVVYSTTLGNALAGVLIFAIPFWIISKERKQTQLAK